MDSSALKRAATEEIDRIKEELIELSCRIHANPELAFQEHKAAEWLIGQLVAHGFHVERGVCALETAFKATHGNGHGPRIAILGEYDALAGLGHACGHNIIGTACVGAAIAVKRTMPDLDGEVIALGTPAEEGGLGKVIMLERGAFEGVDAAMMVHPGTRTEAKTRTLASVRFEVEFRGKSAHAAARPWEGINALDALILSYNNIGALRQHIRSDARIHGIITNGGEAVNVVPAYAAGRFSVRAADNSYLKVLQGKVLNCFQAAAEATGAQLNYELTRGYAAMNVNAPLAEAFAANMSQLGLQVQEHDPSHGIGSTDMGDVSLAVPGIHPSIAIAPPSIPSHSPDFAAAAVSEAGHQGLLYAAKALAMTAIDLLTNPELLARVKREFAKG